MNVEKRNVNGPLADDSAIGGRERGGVALFCLPWSYKGGAGASEPTNGKKKPRKISGWRQREGLS